MKYIKLFENNKGIQNISDNRSIFNSIIDLNDEEIIKITNLFKGIKTIVDSDTIKNKNTYNNYIFIPKLGIAIFKLEDDYYLFEILEGSASASTYRFKCDQISNLIKCVNIILNYLKLINGDNLILESNESKIVKLNVDEFSSLMREESINMPKNITEHICKNLQDLDPDVQEYEHYINNTKYKGVYLKKIDIGIYLLYDDYYGVEVFKFRINDNRNIYFKCDQLSGLYECIKILNNFIKIIN